MTEILRPAPNSAKTPHRAKRTNGKRPVSLVIFGLAGIIFLVTMSVLNIARIGYTYLAVFPVNANTIGDSEPARWAASNYGIAQLVEFANETLAEKDRIFAFRQSDLAYYAKNPIAVYTDNAYAPLFRLQSAAELRQALLIDRIRYVALPPYGMSEVNNSAFGKLLSDPKMARLIFELDGNRLFELTALEAHEVQQEEIRSFDLRDRTERDRWNVVQIPQPLLESFFTGPAKLEKTSSGATVRRSRPIIASETLEDVLQPWDLSIDATPSLTGNSDFKVENGVYRFEGLIAGDGMINLYVDLYSRTRGEDVRWERKLLWSGVLNDEALNIGGQFKVLIGGDEGDMIGPDRQSARLFFGLKNGSYLTVQSLSLRKILVEDGMSSAGSKQSRDFEALRRAYRSGWEIVKPIGIDRLYSEPSHVFGMTSAGTIIAKQTSGDSRQFSSPTYLLPTDLMSSETAFRMQKTSEGVKPVVEVQMRPSGNGLLRIAVTGTCLQPRAPSITSEPLASESVTTFEAKLPSVSLRREGRTYRESVVLGCTPSSFKAVFGVTHDTMKSPPDFTMGEAQISDFDITLNAWAAGQDFAEIPLVRSSDVRPPIISTPQVQLPDYGQ
ncbi:MAG TPA: hypothetical protein PKV67_01395 [Hyphomonas sp.]|nr:hypothetical protein [Hyphomonas sp.]